MQREETESNPIGRTEEEERPDQPATDGVGPLLQRDYVLVLEGSSCTPEEVVKRLRSEFPGFAPPALVTFERPSKEEARGPLALNDTMHVHIRGAGHAGVRVSHFDARSLTLRTLEGHQEAGRITFGATTDEAGRLIVRIRSRARQRNIPRFIGYELLGKHAQTAIWVSFLKAVAETCGGKMLGDIMLSTEEVADSVVDAGAAEAPTFVAR